jgi:exodeoxyribonuclease-5
LNTISKRHLAASSGMSAAPGRLPVIQAPDTATPDQKQVIAALNRFLRDGTKHFVFDGCGGTGKSWTIQRIVQSLIEQGCNVEMLATTNKALNVIRAGNPGLFRNAKTVDAALRDKRMIVKEMPATPAEQRAFGRATVPRRFYSSSSKLSTAAMTIVDESSMLSDHDAFKLQATRAKLICVGDAFQLPPVAASDWFGKQKPNASLTTVMRQAADSGVLKLATSIRKDGLATAFARLAAREFATDVEILDSDAALQLAGSVSMILCHQNATVTRLNAMVMNSLGLPHNVPSPGARLYSVERFYDPDNAQKIICEKGLVFHVIANHGATKTKTGFPAWLLDLRDDEGNTIRNVPVLEAGLVKPMPSNPQNNPIHFCGAEMQFAYALTVHKAQGSEWPVVLLWDDFVGDEATYTRWFYTGVTRARQMLLVVP